MISTLRRQSSCLPADCTAPEDYDYSRPTSENYRTDGREVVGNYADIRSKLDFDYHGCYTVARQKLQDIIILDSIGKGIVHERPWLIFTAGAMGAGKGHTLEWMSKKGYFLIPDIVHVDPDKFRTELPEWPGYLARDATTAGRSTHRESGYLVEIATEAAMTENKHVWVDGSLRDAEWYTQVFKQMRDRYPSFRIAILHVLASWETVQARAASRAQETGRVVPDAELRNSFEQVPDSVARLAPLADFVAHIENETHPRLVATLENGIENNVPGWKEITDRFATLAELSTNKEQIARWMDCLVETRPIVIFSRTTCSYSTKVKKILAEVAAASDIHTIELDIFTHQGGTPGAAGVAVGHILEVNTRQRTIPQVYIGGKHIGGCDAVSSLKENDQLAQAVKDAVQRSTPG